MEASIQEGAIIDGDIHSGIKLRLNRQGPLTVHELLSRPRVAIIGARAATAYGNEMARDLAAQAARAGFVVISGGAYGIDAAAHRGALDAGGITVAVLACGVDIAYPRGNDQLFKAIANTGAILSEYPDGSAPTRERFLARNRIVALLAQHVILVEAATRSGSLNTVRHARDRYRPVYAVPGPVNSVMSIGCHDAIKAGAHLLTSISDLRL